MNKNESKTVIEHSSIVHACTNLLTFILRITMSTDTTANNKRIAKNTIYLYMRTFITIIVSLYTSRVLLSALGVEDFGIFNAVGGIVALLAFFRSSIANGIQRFLNLELGKSDKDGLQSSFACSISVTLIVAISLFVLCELIAPWFLNTQMSIPENRLFASNIVLQLSIACMVVTLMQCPYHAAIIAYEKMSFYAYLSIFEAVSKLLIVFLISAISSVDSLIFYSLLYFAMTLLVCLINIFYAHRHFLLLKSEIGRDKATIKELFKFSGWNIFGTLSGMLKSYGINILLNLFFGPVVNAARGIAFQVMSAVNNFVMNFQLASKAQTIQLYASGDVKKAIELTYYISRISFYLIWILTVPFLFEIDFILNLWLGDNVPEYTSSFCIVCLLTATIDSLGNPISTMVHATGKLKNYQIVVSSVIMLIVPIAYWFLKYGYGPLTAMIVSLCIAPIAQLSRLIMFKKIVAFSISDYFKVVIIPCIYIGVLSLILPYLLSFLEIYGVIFHLLYICFIILSTTLCVYFVGLTNSERTKIKNLITSKIH